MKKDKIYIKDWLQFKPYKGQKATDLYYLKLSNKVYKALMDIGPEAILGEYLYEDEIKLLSCFLCAYFEDVISETSIWPTFVKAHEERYGKKLPFYDTEVYYDGEINTQDVVFLIWYFLNCLNENHFVYPFASIMVELADAVMQIFEDAWEDAPENEDLKAYYCFDGDVDDYYLARSFMETVFFDTYLFFPDTTFRFLREIAKTIKSVEDQDHIEIILKDVRDNSTFTMRSKLMAFSAKDWTTQLIGAKHPFYEHYQKMSQRIAGSFFYKGQNSDTIFLEHIASGRKFELVKKSYDEHKKLTDIDTILYIGMVQWNGEWWFSGIAVDRPFDANFILDEKNSLESRSQVNFLDHREHDPIEAIRPQYEAFKKYNKGEPIAFLPSDKINDFMHGFYEYYNTSLNLSKKEIAESEQRAKKDGFFGNAPSDKNIVDVGEADSGLVYFNPKAGIEMALDSNSAFPLSHNPFFKEEESEEDIEYVLMSDEQSTELAKYCFDHGKDRLPFFTEGPGLQLTKDFDFLLRFWKCGQYTTTVKITYTGIDR